MMGIVTACKRVPAAALALPLALVLTLTGCSSSPPPPDWAIALQGHVERAQAAQLAGRSTVADSEWRRARGALSATGQPALAARIELVACATALASLDLQPCTGYLQWADAADPAERAYAQYLRGQAPAQPEALPAAHRDVAASLAAPALVFDAARLPADPLARLVAAAVLLQAGRLDARGVAAAVEAASAQGWRRPLLAWLGVQEKLALQAGQTALAQQARRRIELASLP